MVHLLLAKHETRNAKRRVSFPRLDLGDREAILRDAIIRLDTLGRVTAVSSFYETEPVDFLDQPWFLNCVVLLEPISRRKSFCSAFLEIERSLGRERLQPKGPRLMTSTSFSLATR